MRHPHQIEAVRIGLEALRAGRSLLIVAPTGAGKSYVLLDCLAELPDAYIVVPSHEIAADMWRKQGNIGDPSQATLEAARLYTVKRLHNLMLKGEVPIPKQLLLDEAHHSPDATNSLIYEACGRCPRLGLTATAFRGTAKETASLRALWPEMYRALTLKDAVAKKIVALPTVSVWPLINDDLIDVASNGEFVVTSVDAAVNKVLPDVIDRSRVFYTGNRWVRPIVYCVSSVEGARQVTDALNTAGLPAVKVTGETKERPEVFKQVLDCEKALVQVKVVGEGVDLAL